MLHSTIPPIADDGYAALLKILADILDDPEKHRQRLEELRAQEKATRDEINALNQMAAITRRRSSEVEADKIVLANRKTKLDAREAEINERAQNLETAEARRSDRALQAREIAVSAREEAATREAERLAAMRKDYEDKLARIKNSAGALHH